MSKELANLIFPNVTLTKEELENKYPIRKETTVTRFAPSPTGFLHIGGVYTALINEKITRQNNGRLLLRLEDTDKKREIEGSKDIIVNTFNSMGIIFDEGVDIHKEKGSYGPYTQSLRKDIYQALAKDLIERNLAYPCFLTEEELEIIKDIQVKNKEMFGLYGKYAKYQDITSKEAKTLIDEGKSFVVRFKSPAKFQDRIEFEDLIKGNINMEDNLNHVVILKSDGMPTYHFAHACDDHLMRVTHVIRSDEWLASVPLHLQLFNALGFSPPKYAHVAPVMKQDGESRRKLSKRKDKEANASFYLESGYLNKALYVYLYTLISSNFEKWYLENQDKNLSDFDFDFSNMSLSGALYDLDKLNNISSEIIFNLSKEENMNNLLNFAKEYNDNLYKRLNANMEFTKKLLSTQGKDSNEKRKDLYNYSMFLEVFGLFYNDIFDNGDSDYLNVLYEKVSKEDISLVANKFVNYFSELKNGSQKTLKEFALELGYTDKRKYLKEQNNFKGINTSIYQALRLMITHKTSGISMDDIYSILGYDEIIRRISLFI